MAVNPSESASRVPNITALRTALQYGDLRLPRCEAFNSSLTFFRKSYVTSTGIRGMEVRDWKSAEHQTLLTEMSHAFLDRDGNGELYWPTDITSPNHNSLQYANQQSLIRKCVKELLYRSNVQQYRNTKYRRKGLSVEDDNDDAHEYPVDSIEIFSADEAPTSATGDAHSHLNTGESVEVARNKSNGQGNTVRQAQQLSTASSHTSPVPTLEDDVFEIPDDFDWVPPQGTSNASKRRLKKGGSSQRPKRAKPCLPRRVQKRTDVHDARDSPIMSPAIPLNGTSESALNSEHTERMLENPQGDSAAPSTELSVATPIHRTPEELIDYIRSNRPLTTLRPNDVPHSDQPTASANVSRPIDLELERLGTVPSAGLSSGSREDDIAVSSPRDLERLQHTLSPIAPSRTVPDSEEPPEKRTVDLAKTQPTLKSTSMCADAVSKMVQIRYRLAFMHRSLPVREVWAPKGSLLNKTLRSLELEIPLKKEFQSFVLRLLTPDYHAEHVVGVGDEFGFDYAKNHINQVIRLLALNQLRTQPNKAVPIFIEIEPQGSHDEEGDMEALESVKIEW